MGRTIAAFTCPVCDSPVIAHGYRWVCTRPTCSFTIGRSYRSDPRGHYVKLLRSIEADYASSRERYRVEQDNPQPHINELEATLNEPNRAFTPKEVKWIKTRIAELEAAKHHQPSPGEYIDLRDRNGTFDNPNMDEGEEINEDY